MNGKYAAALIAGLLTTPAALAFDPLLSESDVGVSAVTAMMQAEQPCTFGPLARPLGFAEAISRTLCFSPKARAAWADAKEQAALVGQARAAFLPTVSGTWQGVRDRSETDVKNFPQLSSASTATVRSASVSFNWVLFDFGARVAAHQSASAMFAAALATENATLQDEFATAAKDYFAAQAAQEALEVAQDVEKMAHDSLVVAKARADRGVAPVTDVLQAQTQYEQAVLNTTRSESDALTLAGTLASDMGFDPDVSVVLPSVVSEAQPDVSFTESASRLIDEVKHTHPSVVAAQATYDAALRKIAQTRAEGLPTVSLIGKYSRNNQPASLGLGSPTFPATGHDAYIGLQVSIPFFEGFSRHYQTHQAQAQAEHAQDMVDDTVQHVALDVWTSYNRLNASTKNAIDSAKLVDIAQRAWVAAQHRYRAGVSDILELLTTQAAFSNARQRRVLAIADWKNSRVDLAAKLGRLGHSDLQF
ncbi:protein CyaE [Paraburkholderia terrae]|uniref:Protein CyaE n=1 Tax=Paraburkholderia terrae TaxID=311230 RepID=A0ABM7TYU1_9BURK|nr:TolC family protein [Paraburkholderia terrae]BCZ84057.1 protein CyaE [Paraburkholderia terrae]